MGLGSVGTNYEQHEQYRYLGICACVVGARLAEEMCVFAQCRGNTCPFVFIYINIVFNIINEIKSRHSNPLSMDPLQPSMAVLTSQRIAIVIRYYGVNMELCRNICFATNKVSGRHSHLISSCAWRCFYSWFSQSISS